MCMVIVVLTMSMTINFLFVWYLFFIIFCHQLLFVCMFDMFCQEGIHASLQVTHREGFSASQDTLNIKSEYTYAEDMIMHC